MVRVGENNNADRLTLARRFSPPTYPPKPTPKPPLSSQTHTMATKASGSFGGLPDDVLHEVSWLVFENERSARLRAREAKLSAALPRRSVGTGVRVRPWAKPKRVTNPDPNPLERS